MKIKRKVLRLLSMMLCLICTISGLGIQTDAATALIAKTGYTIAYCNNSSAWTEFGVPLSNFFGGASSCDNMEQSTYGRECVHYVTTIFGFFNDMVEGDWGSWGAAPTSINDERWERALSSYGCYAFPWDLGAAFLCTDNTIWLVYNYGYYTCACGNDHGSFREDEGCPICAGRRTMTCHCYTPDPNWHSCSPSGFGFDMRFYFIGSTDKCIKDYKYKFVKNHMAYCHGSDGLFGSTAFHSVADGAHPQFGMNNTEFWRADRDNGSSDPVIGRYVYNQEALQNIQTSDGILKLKKLNYNHSEKYYNITGMWNPTVACWLGARNRGAFGYGNPIRYNADGSINWYSSVEDGYEIEGCTHYVYQYRCLGHYVPNTYTVVYNGNGNTGGAAPANQSCTYDVAFNLRDRNTLTRTGYMFKGWSTDPNLAYNATTGMYSESQQVINLTTTPNGTVTMYAIWEPVTYDVNVHNNKPGEASGSIQNIK